MPLEIKVQGQAAASRGDLDAWTLVLVPKEITLTATVDTKFSATSSVGFVYEEINQHRFLTR
jgi:hypothetical protein